MQEKNKKNIFPIRIKPNLTKERIFRITQNYRYISSLILRFQFQQDMKFTMEINRVATLPVTEQLEAIANKTKRNNILRFTP